MEIKNENKNSKVLRFNQGEEVISVLKEYCKNNGLKSGFFFGLGACREVSLSYYDLNVKEYLEKEFKKNLEVVSFSGNIAKSKEDLVIHAHGVFSDSEMKTIGGHVNKMIISATLEIKVTFFEEDIKREYDENTGLKLMSN